MAAARSDRRQCHIPFAAAALATQAPYPAATNVGWGIIAAIGYPADEAYDGVRRSWDLSPPPGTSYPPFSADGPAVITGGADGLVSFIEHDLLPRVAEMALLDVTRKALFGSAARFAAF